MTQPIQLATAPGHQVLAAAGKTRLRPGGQAATEQLLQWANMQPGETVLELASSFGHSAIALAQRYQVRVVGVEKNPDSVARARANIAAAGLSDQVQVVEADIFHLDQIKESFNYVLAEAILTMQSTAGKAKILAGVYDHLKPSGQFLSHELLARTNPDLIHRQLSQVIRVNATPLSQAGWSQLCSDAGLTVNRCKTGKMGLLNPLQILRDEGAIRALTILWNIATNAEIRQRVQAMRRVFNQHQNELGYIILTATKPA